MIRSMNRLLKVIAKGASGVLPSSIKNKLKQNNKLLAFYSRALQQRVLFFGCLPRRELDKSYQHIFNQQQVSLNQLPDKQTKVFDLAVLVAIHKVDSLAKTLSSVPTNITVHIVCRRNDTKQVSRLTEKFPDHKLLVYPSPTAQLETDNSVFFIQAGQLIDKQLGKALYHWSQDNDVLYTDKDYLIGGKYQNPVFLPDWNPDFQLSAAYIRTGIWFKNQDDIPAIISCHAQTIAEWAAHLYLDGASKQISRIPYSLVHDTESRKFNYNSYANTLTMLNENKAAIKVNAFVGKLTWRWRHNNPLVSIIIPISKQHDFLNECVASLLRTAYSNIEILLVKDASFANASAFLTDELAKNPKVNIVEYDKPYHFAGMVNSAVNLCQGDVVGVVDSHIEAINSKWLRHIVSNVSRPDIGCVGAKLFYSDGRVKHAGIVMGNDNQIGYVHNYFPGHDLGYLKRLVVNQNYSALDGACLFVKKQDFLAANGFNTEDFRRRFVDIDFCQRISSLGKRNLFCANAKLYHHTLGIHNINSGDDKAVEERGTLSSLWPAVFKDDPAYNPNLSLKHENFSPRSAKELKQMILLPKFHLQ